MSDIVESWTAYTTNVYLDIVSRHVPDYEHKRITDILVYHYDEIVKVWTETNGCMYVAFEHSGIQQLQMNNNSIIQSLHLE